jgi:hypothetical protein
MIVKKPEEEVSAVLSQFNKLELSNLLGIIPSRSKKAGK